MDRKTVLTKTAKGLMEATGKTSALSRDMRALLKEIDGKATFGELQARFAKVPEAKLQEALQTLVTNDFVREFKQPQTPARQQTPAAPQGSAAADVDLDFTMAIPTLSPAAGKAEEEAKLKAAAAAAAAEAARARAAADAKAKLESEAKAKAAAAAAARARAEANAKAEALAKAKAAEQARIEAQARAEAEEKARREAEELRARLEEERKAREAAERRAKEEAERKAREDEERRAREEAERKAREQAEREREEAEERARREAEELRARLEEERKAREEAERKAKEEAERRAREDAEREVREAAERARHETEEKARREAEEQAQWAAEERARAEETARIEAEGRAREQAEAERKAKAERAHLEAEEKTANAATALPQTPVKSAPSLEHLVDVDTDFDAAMRPGGGATQQAAMAGAGADEKSQKEAEQETRRQAEELASKAAADQARAEVDAQAKIAQEARRREDEAQRQPGPDDAEERAAAHAREHAEAQARLEALNAETERHFADMEKELEAEQAAAPGRKPQPETREPARRREEAAAQAVEHEAEAEVARAPEVYRKSVNWGKPVALVLFLILMLGVVAVHFIAFDAYIPQFEKLAGSHLQQPVKIKALHLSLLPQPHWRLDGVSVGNEGQLAVPRVNATAELGSMFGDRKVFTSIELDSPVLGEDGLLGLLFGKPAGQDFRVANIVVKNGKLDSKTVILPALDAKIAFGENGAWQKIALETPDHKTSLLLKPEADGTQLEVETNAFSLPFDPSFILENFVAKGLVRRGELRMSEFKGGIYGGYLSGNARLKWGANWSLDGEVKVRAMDPGRFAPALLEDGKLEGGAQYAMSAKSYEALFATPRLEGNFAIEKGTLLGADLGRLLQGGGIGGKTAFAELTGSFIHEAGRTQLRQIHLGAGPVSASGSADADSAKRISGRFSVDLKSPVAKAHANLLISGTLREPRLGR